MGPQALRDIKRKKAVFAYAKETKNVSKACRRFGISRETFYKWQRNFENEGEQGLINSKPCPQNPNLRVPKPIEEKVLFLRKSYHFGQTKIAMYLTRYHGIRISSGGVRGVLLRNGVNRLPRNVRNKNHGPAFKSYQKDVPGHHVQVDVKFLTFYRLGKKVRRFQYTAIDDATRVRVLKVYEKHTQANAIAFVDHVVQRMPFRIKMIRTDNGHEFRSLFHWHLNDLGVEHAYITPATPRLNGKVERSHRSDKEEFYQLLKYRGDVDLHKKLKEWENFYNYHRPHGGLHGKTPYEVLREKMKQKTCQS